MKMTTSRKFWAWFLQHTRRYGPAPSVPPTGAADLFVNGEFDADTDWLKGVGWSIADGIAIHTGAVGSNISQVPTQTGIGSLVRLWAMYEGGFGGFQFLANDIIQKTVYTTKGPHMIEVKLTAGTAFGIFALNNSELKISRVALILR